MITGTGRRPGPGAKGPVTAGHLRLFKRYAIRVGRNPGGGWFWWISRAGESELAVGGSYDAPGEAVDAAFDAAERIADDFKRRVLAPMREVIRNAVSQA